jgi:hypothetical protein
MGGSINASPVTIETRPSRDLVTERPLVGGGLVFGTT